MLLFSGDLLHQSAANQLQNGKLRLSHPGDHSKHAAQLIPKNSDASYLKGHRCHLSVAAVGERQLSPNQCDVAREHVVCVARTFS